MIQPPKSGHYGAEAPVRDRLSPYRLLVYLLYMEDSAMVEPLGNLKIRLNTGEASRYFTMRSVVLWQQLFWLQDAGLVEKVDRGRKRGQAIITLLPVTRG
jgi:hypothetical protein